MRCCRRSRFLLAAVFIGITATDVRAFVSHTTATGLLTQPKSKHVSSTNRPRPSYPAAIAAPAVSTLVRRVSPFDQGEGSDEDDIASQEAEQLEEMIRGRRGIVVEVIEREWREEMLRVMGTDGARLCAEAFDGYQMRGRGAILVNVDMGLSSSRKGHDGAACHAVYRTLEEVVTERSSRVKPSDQMQIIQRCQEYDPEAGFVLVFGYKGMLGVQVMRPSLAPREIHRARQSP